MGFEERKGLARLHRFAGQFEPNGDLPISDGQGANEGRLFEAWMDADAFIQLMEEQFVRAIHVMFPRQADTNRGKILWIEAEDHVIQSVKAL